MRSSPAIQLLGVLVVVSWSTTAAGVDRKGPPQQDGKPVDVQVGFYIVDFARVTSRDESFDATGYLEMSWHEPELSIPSDSAERKGRWRPVDPSTIWTPRVFFENATEQPKFHNEPVVEVDDEGVVTSWVILSGKFSTPMDLEQFPFDREVLSVRIASFDDESAVRFTLNPKLVQIGDEAFVTDWRIIGPTARVDLHRYVPAQEAYWRLIYQVTVERKATFYVWRVMVPLSLLVFVSWAAFWFEPVGLQPQISTCMASLIALVAFNFAIDFSLPKVAYLTLIDKHALIGFGFVAGAVLVVTIIHLCVNREKLRTAKFLQWTTRVVFPLAYGLALAWNLESLWLH
jgi:hypothetical protein